MAIKYLIVRPSEYVPKMTRYDATHITALIHQSEYLKGLELKAKDIMGICFEQMLLTNYLLNMNPDNQQLKDYKNKIKTAYTRALETPIFKKENLDSEYINLFEVGQVLNYVTDNQYIGGAGLENILKKYTAGASKYTSVPIQFSYPYLEFRHKLDNEEYSSTPVVLSPFVRYDHETGDQEVTFYCRTFTSLHAGDSSVSELSIPNRSLAYICSMNYNGKSWKELVDVIQSTHISDGSAIGTESLSGLLHAYIQNKAYSPSVSTKGRRDELCRAFNAVYSRDALVLSADDHADLAEFVEMFNYLRDPRLKYLLLDDPTVAQEQDWKAQLDLQFLNPLVSKRPYAMAADDDSSSENEGGGDEGGDAPADDSAGGEDEGDTSTDSDDMSDEGDDLFGDGDDFADEGDEGKDEDGDEENGSGSDSQTDTNSSSDSSSTDSSTSDDATTDEEKVNPVIELIDDETFDEYLDRGILQVRIKRLLINPPTTLSSADIEFLKYWYLVWFPCVSVATTREMLSNIIALPSKKLSMKKIVR